MLVHASRGDSQESATENRPPSGFARPVRVKRCGKSAPASPATGVARQTPPGARSRRERAVRPQTLPGRLHRWMVIHGPSGPGQNPAYRSTPRHHIPRSRLGNIPSRAREEGGHGSVEPHGGVLSLVSVTCWRRSVSISTAKTPATTARPRHHGRHGTALTPQHNVAREQMAAGIARLTRANAIPHPRPPPTHRCTPAVQPRSPSPPASVVTHGRAQVAR